ncbi:MAG TPA: hypothetical protein G4O00_08570 [Thermoflexia bacterium]|jgi:hypothetical protein|nr:hypothetical protein [Thermoflexia bacterium]
MDTFLDFLARLNWLERIGEWVRAALGIRSWRFCVPRNCGWSGYEIERFLRRYGVKIWGRDVSDQYISFRVKIEQANWAEYLLWRKGIPVCSPPLNPRNRLYYGRYPPGSEPRPGAPYPSRAEWLEFFRSFLP